jgi:hypothetical protein
MKIVKQIIVTEADPEIETDEITSAVLVFFSTFATPSRERKKKRVV